MAEASPGSAKTDGLSDYLKEELERVLGECRTTADVSRRLRELGPVSTADSVLKRALRNALRTELQRRESADEAQLYGLVEEALLTGDLRPYWAACELYASSSPELAGRMFSHEPEEDDLTPPPDMGITREVFEEARAFIRQQIAAIEEAQPTGSMIEAFAVVEDAIEREHPAHREPLKAALEAERKRQARTARNLLRTRIALSLGGGRSYDHFLTNRTMYADLAAEDRAAFFGAR
jgi:hypothetical protein